LKNDIPRNLINGKNMNITIIFPRIKTGKETSVTGLMAIVISLWFLFAGFMEPAKTHAVEALIEQNERWTGDLDGMAERHFIRALVPYSKTFYFLDSADQRGIAYELLKHFEKQINKTFKKSILKIKVIVIPTKRDRLLPALLEGVGDIAVGNLTITPEREKLIDFADPSYSGVNEIIAAGPTATSIKTVDDLAGKEIHVRKSSSYYVSLTSLNDQFKKSGKTPMKLVLADELLEDEDLLEMMNVGLIPMIVIDSHKAKFWAQIFKKIHFYYDIRLRTEGKIAWAFRKNSPKLKKALNQFVKKTKKGTLLGNILFKRYLKDTKWVENSLNEKEFRKFQEATVFLKKYSERYDFDWVMVGALAYQESRIDQSKRSPAGAIGIMQLLPSTAADPNVNIADIETLERNIHAGTKYLRFLRDRYFEKEPMSEKNKMLFSFASYNAGPAKVARLRREARKSGLDPNIWFRNVEIIAAKRIGRETVQYVSNIYKYYTAYRLILNKLDEKEQKMRMKKEESS
jgi:membrane-bound lytic murein transglycosylase MltF